MSHAPPSGLIEVHSHLLPGVDDGSRSPAESINIARRLVAHGYTRLVCTPHVWPNLPHNNTADIRRAVADLQAKLDDAAVPLKLHAGGEISLIENLLNADPDSLPSYAGLGRHLLVDAWLDEWEPWLTPVIRHLQSRGHTLILAHPERMALIQMNHDNARRFTDLGLLLQGNLYTLVDEPTDATRETVDHLLHTNQYFMLGGDIHRETALESRFRGLAAAFDRLGPDVAYRLLRNNPLTLLG
jgi:protein-tyrosine phosphatase